MHTSQQSRNRFRDKEMSAFVDFTVKLIVNLRNCFDSLGFGQQLTMSIQNTFIITDVREFSKEVTQPFKWVNQNEISFQAHQ